MKIVYEYSHLGGRQILMVDYPTIFQQIKDVIKSIEKIAKTKVSKEKTMIGRLLYDPKELNKLFKEAFRKKEFKELRDRYDVKIPNYKTIIKGAYKQIDFVKNDVLVEVQFGKYAFMFYDMAKFQYFFMKIKQMLELRSFRVITFKNKCLQEYLTVNNLFTISND